MRAQEADVPRRLMTDGNNRRRLCAAREPMNSNYRLACLQLFGWTFQIPAHGGPPLVVVTTHVTDGREARLNGDVDADAIAHDGEDIRARRF
jgi:hypothetical protein